LTLYSKNVVTFIHVDKIPVTTAATAAEITVNNLQTTSNTTVKKIIKNLLTSKNNIQIDKFQFTVAAETAAAAITESLFQTT